MKTQIIRLSIAGVNEYHGGPQSHNIDIQLSLNSHGNYQADSKCVHESVVANRSFIPFPTTNVPIVFDRNFKCVSHRPSSKYRFHAHNYVAYLPQ